MVQDLKQNISSYGPDSLRVQVTLLAVSTLVVLSSSAISPSLPAIQAHFQNVENSAYWVKMILSLPALFVVIGGTVSGQLIDRFGRKRLLIITVILFSLAGGSGFFLDNLSQILVGRGILGLATAAIGTCATTLIADYYIQDERSRLMGFQTAAIAFVRVLALGASGILADLYWRIPFLLHLLPLGLVPALILFLHEPGSYADDGLLEQKVLPSSQGSFKQSLQQTSEQAPEQAPEQTSEQDSEQPYFLEDTVSSSTLPWFTLALIYSLEFTHLFFFIMTAIELPFYLQDNFQLSATYSGFAIGSQAIAQVISAFYYSKIKPRLGFGGTVTACYALVALGYGIVALAPTYSSIIVGLMISGFGFGALFPNAKVWLAEIAPKNLRGRVLGGLVTVVCLGEFLSPFVSQPTVVWVGHSGLYGLSSALLVPIALIGLALQLGRLPAVVKGVMGKGVTKELTP